jgi:hypothetical protein
MTRDGLQVRLPFTHLQLAEMIATRRSTVSAAVGRLVAEDRLRRPGRNLWLLPHRELIAVEEARGVSRFRCPLGCKRTTCTEQNPGNSGMFVRRLNLALASVHYVAAHNKSKVGDRMTVPWMICPRL